MVDISGIFTPGFIEVLKWVGIVFAAGFVGYFGKYLGKIIIAKFSKDKAVDKTVPSRPQEPALDNRLVEAKIADAKAKKKLQKARIKEKKKLAR